MQDFLRAFLQERAAGGGSAAAYLPVVEDGQGEGLALRVCAQVRLEAKRVDGRDEGLDGVERGARDGSVLGDVTPEGRHATQGHGSESSSQPRSHISLIIPIPVEQSSTAHVFSSLFTASC